MKKRIECFMAGKVRKENLLEALLSYSKNSLSISRQPLLGLR